MYVYTMYMYVHVVYMYMYICMYYCIMGIFGGGLYLACWRFCIDIAKIKPPKSVRVIC